MKLEKFNRRVQQLIEDHLPSMLRYDGEKKVNQPIVFNNYLVKEKVCKKEKVFVELKLGSRLRLSPMLNVTSKPKGYYKPKMRTIKIRVEFQKEYWNGYYHSWVTRILDGSFSLNYISAKEATSSMVILPVQFKNTSPTNSERVRIIKVTMSNLLGSANGVDNGTYTIPIGGSINVPIKVNLPFAFSKGVVKLTGYIIGVDINCSTINYGPVKLPPSQKFIPPPPSLPLPPINDNDPKEPSDRPIVEPARIPPLLTGNINRIMLYNAWDEDIGMNVIYQQFKSLNDLSIRKNDYVISTPNTYLREKDLNKYKIPTDHHIFKDGKGTIVIVAPSQLQTFESNHNGYHYIGSGGSLNGGNDYKLTSYGQFYEAITTVTNPYTTSLGPYSKPTTFTYKHDFMPLNPF